MNRTTSRAAVPVILAGRGCVALALVLASSGCDTHDSEERQLAEMTRDIDRLQVERDEEDKRTLPTDVADTHFASVPMRQPAPALPPPPAIASLEDDGAREADAPDTEDPTPRPTIRVVGSARPGRDGRESSFDDSSGARSSPSSVLDPDAKPAYDAALRDVGRRQYDRALDELASFLVRWPDHPYADNALFWRGECYFAKGDYLHAAEQFEGVITRFPAGSKAPDALLKLGVSNLKMGNPTKAKEVFDRLSSSFPRSDAARRIPPVTVQAATPSGPASEDHR